MVYVDNDRNAFRNMKMCHMLADTLVELHEMADKIGIKRKWFQGKRTPHYDVCLSKRKLAVEHGAQEIDRRKAGQIIRKWRDLRALDKEFTNWRILTNSIEGEYPECPKCKGTKITISQMPKYWLCLTCGERWLR